MSLEQLDLFSSTPMDYTEVTPSMSSSEAKVTPSPLGKGSRSNESDNNVDSGLGQDRLAHYRAKMAELDRKGYYDVIVDGQPMNVLNVIESDTIHGHNKLGEDMRIVINAIRRKTTLGNLRKSNRTALIRYHLNKTLKGKQK